MSATYMSRNMKWAFLLSYIHKPTEDKIRAIKGWK